MNGGNALAVPLRLPLKQIDEVIREIETLRADVKTHGQRTYGNDWDVRQQIFSEWPRRKYRSRCGYPAKKFKF